MHSHGHAHPHAGPSGPADPTVVRVVLAVIVPLAVATLAALVWMWPGEVKAGGAAGEGMTKVGGTIVDIDLKPCPRPVAPPGAWPAAEPGAAPGGAEPGVAPRPADPRRCGNAHVRMEDGEQAGRVVTVALPDGPGTQTFETGDDVVLLRLPGGGPGTEPGTEPGAGAPGAEAGGPYQLSDHDRSTGLWLVGAAFALAVVAFGRWRGVTALVGLAVTFGLLLTFLIPAILNGSPPLAAAIVCAAAIMLAVLYLTHGVSVATSIAVIGTLASLALTGLLAWLAIRLTHLSGITDDSSLNLDLGYQISTQGLLLASIIIGSLGVLDDVTVTQSATVTELARANPAYRFGRLYRAAARVGRAHIASVINTIILAYAGASLPLMLLFTVGRQPLGEVVTGPVIAQEIVRGAAGTIGLIAAVPITTALAAFAVSRRPGRDPAGRAGGTADEGAPGVPRTAGSGM